VADLKEKKVPDDLSHVYSVLSHPIRRKIIELVAENDVSFTELMQELGLNETGTLTFHLRQMERALEKTADAKYRLSELGRIAHSLSAEGEKSIGLRKFSPTEEIKKTVTKFSSDFAGLLFSPSRTLRRIHYSQNAFLPFPIFLIFLFPLATFILRNDLSEMITRTPPCFLTWFASIFIFKYISEHLYRKQVNLRNLLYTTGLASFPLTLSGITFTLTQLFTNIDELILSSPPTENTFSKILTAISQPTMFLGLTITSCLVLWFIYLEIRALEYAANPPT